MTAPLTPADCDLRSFPFMPLEVDRLLESDLFALSSGDAFKAAFTLWAKSWRQVPAASIPDNEAWLARAVCMTLDQWTAVAPMALRGWVRCADGRLYHPVVACRALRAWLEKIGLKDRSAKGNATRHQGFVYDPDHYARRKAEAISLLARLQPDAAAEFGVVLTGDETAPSGTASGSLGCPMGTGSGSQLNKTELNQTQPNSTEREVSSSADDASADLDLALEAWRDTAARCGLAQLRALNDTRRKKLLAILKAHGLDGWREALEAVEASSFLRGAKPGRDGRAWKVDFDFLVTPGRFLKVIEGAYADGDGGGYAAGADDYLSMAARVIEGEMAH